MQADKNDYMATGSLTGNSMPLKRQVQAVVAKMMIFAISTLLCLAAGEWVIRKTPIGERVGWNQVPSVPERVAKAPAKKSGEIRILGLGDSFTVYRDTKGGNFLRIASTCANREATFAAANAARTRS